MCGYENSEYCTFRNYKTSQNFHFCVVYNTMNFTLRFYTFLDIIIVYIQDFFYFFKA
jgi:hypothetical protein